LSKQLKELVTDQMLTKTYMTDSNKASFLLTQKSQDLTSALLLIERFAVLCNYSNSGYQSKIEYVKKLIGNKWKSRIIWIIYNSGTVRFNELLNCIEGLSHKVLIEHLNDLVYNALVIKTDYNEKNPRVEYSLSEKGKLSYEIIQTLADWCLKYELIKPKIVINY